MSPDEPQDEYTYLDKSHLEGQLLATQTVLALLLNAHVHHGGEVPNGSVITEAFRRQWHKISDELTPPAWNGFNETMKWFDVGLAGGSPFE